MGDGSMIDDQNKAFAIQMIRLGTDYLQLSEQLYDQKRLLEKYTRSIAKLLNVPYQVDQVAYLRAIDTAIDDLKQRAIL
jgi:hypothetical protein